MVAKYGLIPVHRRPTSRDRCVIESTASGDIEGLPFVAGVGGDTVRGVDNGTYQYSYTAMPNAKTAVLSQAGMDGGDGGWAVLHGSNPLPPSQGTVDLVIDQDQLGNSERKHTTEQVAYFIIDPPLSESSKSNEAIPLAAPMVFGRTDSAFDPHHRAAVTDPAPLLSGPSKLILDAHSEDYGQRRTKIELIDDALADTDDEWSESDVVESLLGSIVLESIDRVR